MTKSHLEFLQTFNENELCNLVLLPLFEAMKYEQIRYNNGPTEFGKDIIFCKDDSLQGRVFYSAVVKARRLTGDVSTNRSLREILHQVEQSFMDETIGPEDGGKISIQHVYIINSYPISQTAIRSVQDKLRGNSGKFTIIDGSSLVSLILKYDPSILNSAPTERSRYISFMANKIISETQISRFGSSRKMSLEDAYISPRINLIEQKNAKNISFGKPDIGSNSKIDPERLKLSLSENYVLIADLGSGKTSFFQSHLMKLNKDISALDKLKSFPVFVPLHALPSSNLREFEKFKIGIEKYVKAQGYPNFSFSETKNIRLILDGFDELRSHHDRVLGHIIKLLKIGNVRVAISSRPSRVPNIKGFTFYHLQPFNDDDLQKYLSLWFDPASEKYKVILSKIMSDSEIQTMCRTPLFLTLYCILASNNNTGKLPTRRLEVYQKITDLLLGDWDSTRRVKNKFSNNLKEKILETVALSSHANNRRFISERELRTACRDRLASSRDLNRYTIKEDEIDVLVAELIYRSGLILMHENVKGARQFEFVHLSFQEYFVAKSLMLSGDIAWHKYLLNDWWRNVMLFAIGMRQSLDDIPLPTAKALKGKSLRLIEYVNEAPFTSSSTKNRLLSIVANEMLATRKKVLPYVSYCEANPSLFLKALKENVSKMTKGHIVNYFEFLTLLNTKHSKRIFCEDIRKIDGVPSIELPTVLLNFAGTLDEEEWREIFMDALGDLSTTDFLAPNKLDRYDDKATKDFFLDLKGLAKESLSPNGFAKCSNKIIATESRYRQHIKRLQK